MHCPVCNASHASPFLSVPDDSLFAEDHRLVYVRCDACGFIYNPRAATLSDAQLAAHYQSDKTYDQEVMLTLRSIPHVLGDEWTYLDFLERHVGRERLRDARILDVGGGNGWFCYQLGLRGYRGDLLDYAADPVGFTRALLAKARPGARIFWSTPNTRSVGARLYHDRWSHFAPNHVGLFDADSTRRFAAQLGLNLLALDAFRMYSSRRYMMVRNIVGNLIKRRDGRRRMLTTDGLCALAEWPG